MNPLTLLKMNFPSLLSADLSTSFWNYQSRSNAGFPCCIMRLLIWTSSQNHSLKLPRQNSKVLFRTQIEIKDQDSMIFTNSISWDMSRMAETKIRLLYRTRDWDETRNPAFYPVSSFTWLSYMSWKHSGYFAPFFPRHEPPALFLTRLSRMSLGIRDPYRPRLSVQVDLSLAEETKTTCKASPSRWTLNALI